MQKVKADRTGNFTVINNYHLHDKNISTSAKTLMTLLLSLPEDWKLSVKGIAKILNESEYAVRRMMKELEAGGYLKKEQHKDVNGRYSEVEFTIYEVPHREPCEAFYEPDTVERQDTVFGEEEQETAAETVRQDTAPDKKAQTTVEYAATQSPTFPEPSPLVEIQQAGNPHMDTPHMGKPFVKKPSAEILTLQNTKNNKILNNNPINPNPVYTDERTGKERTDKIHEHSQSEPDKSCFRRVNPPEAGRRRSDKPAAIPQGGIYGRYRELIMGNIGYDSLKISLPHEIDTVDGLVELMLEVLCCTKPYIRIAGAEQPRELVKARFLKLRCDHMIYILDCLRENTSDVRNVRQYLLAVLFNASATMEGYYTLKVGHDLAAEVEGKTS